MTISNIIEAAWKLRPDQYFWIFLATAVTVWYVQYLWNRRHLYKLSRDVPGPKGWPLVGVIFDFLGGSDAVQSTLNNYFNHYPDVGKAWFGRFLFYFIAKPQYLQTVLTSPKALSKMDFYNFFLPVGGKGLIAAPVPTWKRHRKIIAPTFNQQVLDGFVKIFDKQSTNLCDELQQYVGGEDFDLFGIVGKYALDTICEATMDVKRNGQTRDVMRWIVKSMEIILVRISKAWYHSDFIFKRTKFYQELCQNVRKFDQFVEDIIDEKQNTVTKGKLFLDILMDETTKLTKDEIKDEIKTLLITASDSTATTAAFVFTMLGMHPEIEEKVYREIIFVEKVTESGDLSLLPYTERVIKETLRLFPVGAYIMRDLEDDLPLEDGLVLPKGCSLLLGLIHLHRNSEYWPDPLKFDPDRFLPEEVAKRHSSSYLPFSFGPRNCIGFKYGLMNLKVIIAMAVRRFKFRTSYKKVKDVRLRLDLTLKPRDGFKVSFELRQ